jgi:hypothetical protein
MTRPWCALLIAIAVALPVHADFTLREAAPRMAGFELAMNTRFELALSEKVEEALHKGIVLHIIIEAELAEQRWYWDKVITKWALRRHLRYHALSGRYVVTDLYEDEIRSFDTLPEALRHLGNLSSQLLMIAPNKNIKADAPYELRLRARLDIEALPAPLRPVAYTSPSWLLNSGWTAWSVQR